MGLLTEIRIWRRCIKVSNKTISSLVYWGS